VKDGQDIFDSEVPEAPQTTEGVSPEAPAGPIRDDSGRFAAKDQGEEQSASTDVPGAPPAPAEKTARDIPITALLDEREKRQRAEARLAMLERRFAESQPKPELPDPMTDAEGYTRTIIEAVSQRTTADRLAMSRAFAERDPAIGKALVDEAMAYFDEQPHEVSAQFLNAPLPFHAAVEWFQQQKATAERTSPDYEAKLRERLRAELLAEMGQVSQPSTRPSVPRSLANATGTGREPPPTVSRDPLFD
jgi:hypothetical protein